MTQYATVTIFWPQLSQLVLCPSFSTESDYYTLECLLYFLKNIKQNHAEYVRQARGGVPIVRRYLQAMSAYAYS